jgi:PPOX class probable F420-dependent enzyme
MTEQPPQPGRPAMPAGYGIQAEPDGLLTWNWAAERLARARNYWLATARPDGRPHVAPVWGIWLDGAVMFGTHRRSLKGRNLARNPYLVLHLESGDEVVILEGVVEELTAPGGFQRYADAYAAKYDFRPEPGGPDDVTYRLQPQVALAWLESDFPRTATRWLFDR